MLRAVRNFLCAVSLIFSLNISQIGYSTNEAYLFAFCYIDLNALESLKRSPQNNLLLAYDDKGNNLLLYAVKVRNKEIIKYLYSLNIFDLNEKNRYGENVISLLKTWNDSEMNQIILKDTIANFKINLEEFKAQLELKKIISDIFDLYENSILHFAVMENDLVLLRFAVLNKLINLEHENEDKISALAMAQTLKRTEAESVLKTAIETRLGIKRKLRFQERRKTVKGSDYQSPLSQEI